MTLQEKAVSLLKNKNLTVATAESCTGGLIAKLITDVSGSSEVFGYGLVTYSNEAKMKLLKVKKETLKAHGAVSEETVREMVLGLKDLSEADISVAASGIAGPLSDDTKKPVGLIYIAVYDGKDIRVKRLCNSFSDNIRENNRQSAAEEALNMIIEMVSE